MNNFQNKIFDLKPDTFRSKISVVTCIVECDDHLLFLRRNVNKISPMTWVIPGGKVEKGETLTQAMVRELLEETGIQLNTEDLVFMKTLYASHTLLEYEVHVYYLAIKDYLPITINNDEHCAYIWQHITALRKLLLLEGQLEVLNLSYQKVREILSRD